MASIQCRKQPIMWRGIMLVSRQDQDAFALRSQQRCASAQMAGVFAEEITPLSITQKSGDTVTLDRDEHPRAGVTLDKLARLPGVNGDGSTVTAGNASGINDGAAALLLASQSALATHGLTPLARIVATATAPVYRRALWALARCRQAKRRWPKLG